MAGILAAPVRVDNQAGGGRSVRAYSRALSTSSVGIWAARCQPTTRRKQVSRHVANIVGYLHGDQALPDDVAYVVGNIVEHILLKLGK